MPGWRLPRGSQVFTTCPDVLFIFELVFGGLVWILIALSLVPLPLFQGWVMFVSVFCFIGTGVLFILYMTGAHDQEISWYNLDVIYHSFAALFYLIASVLEALATISIQDDLYFTNEQYLENVLAAVFSSLVTLLYMVHVCCSCDRRFDW